ncbi:hypothetical protein FN846DRAFT_998530 [Sphaerosporella brunnea]|uniref:Uncharacterized protein n=1 Tax=Sphaerosporella brunnea TaxID=1250544 RepID=A0A5J5EI60_9PEZI|nr:hypothetical protein FN846DRAFT_998530 [Sphaerosporella brunnea]
MIVEYAEESGVQRDEYWERISNLKKQIHELKQTKRRKRKMNIPDSGFTLRDKAAFEQFLLEEKARQVEKAQSRFSNAQPQFSPLEEKPTSEQASLKKYRVKEAAGCLNKRYRSAEKVGEKMQKLQVQVIKAREERLARQQHLQEIQERYGVSSSELTEEQNDSLDEEEPQARDPAEAGRSWEPEFCNFAAAISKSTLGINPKKYSNRVFCILFAPFRQRRRRSPCKDFESASYFRVAVLWVLLPIPNQDPPQSLSSLTQCNFGFEGSSSSSSEALSTKGADESH